MKERGLCICFLGKRTQKKKSRTIDWERGQKEGKTWPVKKELLRLSHQGQTAGRQMESVSFDLTVLFGKTRKCCVMSEPSFSSLVLIVIVVVIHGEFYLLVLMDGRYRDTEACFRAVYSICVFQYSGL